MITSLVCNNKRHRISFTHLSKPSTLGGFGFPNLRLYYAAAQFRTIFLFLKAKQPGGWIQIECSYAQQYSLAEIVWHKPSARPDTIAPNPFSVLFLKVWDFYSSILAPAPSPLSLFVGQAQFAPALHPSSFLIWRNPGLTRLCDISRKGVLLSKPILDHKLKASVPWLQYLQLVHLFRNFGHIFNGIRDLTSFEGLLKGDSSTFSGFISICYHLLCAKTWSQPSSFQKAWQKDCYLDLIDGVWPQIWSSSLFRSQSLTIKVQFTKLLTRWYIIPWKLSLFFPKATSQCQKGCGQVGTLIHCFWTWPHIQKFWSQIIYQIAKITAVSLPLNPSLILLDYWPSQLATHSDRDLIANMLTVAKCPIVSYWKRPEIPTVKLWYQNIWDLAAADRIPHFLI